MRSAAHRGRGRGDRATARGGNGALPRRDRPQPRVLDRASAGSRIGRGSAAVARGVSRRSWRCRRPARDARAGTPHSDPPDGAPRSRRSPRVRPRPSPPRASLRHECAGAAGRRGTCRAPRRTRRACPRHPPEPGDRGRVRDRRSARTSARRARAARAVPPPGGCPHGAAPRAAGAAGCAARGRARARTAALSSPPRGDPRRPSPARVPASRTDRRAVARRESQGGDRSVGASALGLRGGE